MLGVFMIPMDIARMYHELNINSIVSYILNYATGNLYWFIPTLFLMKTVLYPVLKKRSYVTITVISLLCIAIGTIWGDIEHQDAIYNYTLARFRFVPFFLIGFVLKQKEESIKIDHKLIAPISIMLMGYFFVALYYYGSGEMNRLTSLCNVFLFYTQALAASFSIWLVIKKLMEKTTLVSTTSSSSGLKNWLMQNMIAVSERTMLIYVLHFIPVIIQRQVIQLSNSAVISISVEILIATLIFTAFIPVCKVVENKAAWLLGKNNKK